MITINVASLPLNPNKQGLVAVANTQTEVTRQRMQAYFVNEKIECKDKLHNEFENKIVVIPEVTQEISVPLMQGKLRFRNKVVKCCCAEFRAELENKIERFT